MIPSDFQPPKAAPAAAPATAPVPPGAPPHAAARPGARGPHRPRLPPGSARKRGQVTEDLVMHYAVVCVCFFGEPMDLLWLTMWLSMWLTMWGFLIIGNNNGKPMDFLWG